MLILKTLTFMATALIALLALRHLQAYFATLDAARARAKVRPQQQPVAPRRLRQDPRTGVYYPES